MRSRTSLLRWPSLAPTLALFSLAGCSAPSEGDDPDGLHDRRSVPALVGEHMYSCRDGSKVDAHFLADGLTLDISRVPDGKPERLSAPATGLTFIGHKVNVTISDGDTMVITRADAKSLPCRRIRTISLSKSETQTAAYMRGADHD